MPTPGTYAGIHDLQGGYGAAVVDPSGGADPFAVRRYTAAVTATELAGVLRVSAHAVGSWCADGRVPGAYRVGRQWRIPVETARDAVRHGVPRTAPVRLPRPAAADPVPMPDLDSPLLAMVEPGTPAYDAMVIMVASSSRDLKHRAIAAARAAELRTKSTRRDDS